MLKLIGCNSNDIVHCNVSAYCCYGVSFIAVLRIQVVLPKDTYRQTLTDTNDIVTVISKLTFVKVHHWLCIRVVLAKL